MKHLDATLHVRGKSVFVSDHNLPDNVLHGALLTSPVPHGTITGLDTSRAAGMNGVVRIITWQDVPGENQIGNIILDEPLFAETEVNFIGEPVALVLADTPLKARNAAGCIGLDIIELPAVTDPRRAFELGMLISPPRTFSMGSMDDGLKNCHHVFSGRADSGGQEHLYLETQRAFAVPAEKGCIRIHSSTQGPSFVQKVAARVLNIPMNRIEVDVGRLGGAFGGKEDQATPWAVMAALGAYLTGRPVKVELSRKEDMRWTGKRHPYSSDYRIGLRDDGRILCWEVTYYQNGGAASDLSTAILERTLFHSTGAYFIPNVRATGVSCRTHLPPNTAFRGFGAPQAMFVMESAIHHASRELGMKPWEIQERNLLCRGDHFPYGMTFEGDELRRSWNRVMDDRKPDRGGRNGKEPCSGGTPFRKGLYFMPVCFGISFTNTSLNQATALVHVYTDGSVGVSTGAVEMGQGVNTKIAQVAARTLGVDISRIKVETTNTTRAANTSPTAASTGADMNGNATRTACNCILERLMAFAKDYMKVPKGSNLALLDETVTVDGRSTDLHWEELVGQTYLARVSLSSQAHYATPDIYFDSSSEKGRPFAYHVTGTAATEVTLDCLRGTFTVDSVTVVHDAGESMNPLVDRGQVEGALLQGIGWVTMEELKYTEPGGELLSDSLATYKVPDIYSAPDEVRVEFLESRGSNAGVYNSKAVGEPPFMYGIGTYFALLEAMASFRPGIRAGYSTPMSNQKLLMLLEDDRNIP